MQGTSLPLPISLSVGPDKELELRLEMQMMAGMDGPHLFRLPVEVEGELLPLVLYVKGLFR
ncbi:MAG: hypothetical protein Q7K03_05620 [Dehalococcoidia bacterium]|nr:hypothetical protein [Dehalococcoidia bacterium]